MCGRLCGVRTGPRGGRLLRDVRRSIRGQPNADAPRISPCGSVVNCWRLFLVPGRRQDRDRGTGWGGGGGAGLGKYGAIFSTTGVRNSGSWRLYTQEKKTREHATSSTIPRRSLFIRAIFRRTSAATSSTPSAIPALAQVRGGICRMTSGAARAARDNMLSGLTGYGGMTSRNPHLFARRGAGRGLADVQLLDVLHDLRLIQALVDLHGLLEFGFRLPDGIKLVLTRIFRGARSCGCDRGFRGGAPDRVETRNAGLG